MYSISCGEDANIFCRTCQSSRCNTCNDLWHSHRLRRDHVTTISIVLLTAVNALKNNHGGHAYSNFLESIQAMHHGWEIVSIIGLLTMCLNIVMLTKNIML